MFLKRIEMQGFKSFADKTAVDFEDAITGIVGPNGCGKSNIADAIRWVLGEQSVKSLRGEKMTDVIFAGSDTHRPVNMAEVTLFFDNSSHILNCPQDEVEITRRIYNTAQEGEYLINKQNVRLKDVIDLFLDSGIGKDSFSMISQGNISSFAESRPYDRRLIFEEAAGVSKYKKNKIDALNRLERTNANLQRAYDVLSELEKQVAPLKRQAKKALIYRENKQRLQEIEIAVLVEEINNSEKKKKELEDKLFELDSLNAVNQTGIQIQENDNAQDRQNLRDLDKQINALQESLFALMNQIQQAEGRKIQLSERRKYQIAQGDTSAKIEELKRELSEAKLEYEDRNERYQRLQSQISLMNTHLAECAMSLADASLEKENKNAAYNRLSRRIELIENLLKDPFSASQTGTKTIMENVSVLNDVYGVVGQEIKPHKGYEYAISAALSGSVYHIVTKDQESARAAISFLKRNQGGRATFLPIKALQAHDIRYEDEKICENSQGYLGIAGDFVYCEPLYDPVADYLLGNVIICDDLKNANELASLLHHRYRIVTLEGDIVHRGGLMTGGRIRGEISLVSAENELEKLKEDIVAAQAAAALADKEYQKIITDRSKTENMLTEVRISSAKLESIVDAKKAKYDKAIFDLSQLEGEQDQNEDSFENDLIESLNAYYAKKDEMTQTIKQYRNDRAKISSEVERREQQLRYLRKQNEEYQEQILSYSKEKASIMTVLDNALSRLASEYQLTYENASRNTRYVLKGDEKEEVISLRNHIHDLGNINMSAPEEFEEVNQRYEFLKKNYDDLKESRDKLLSIVDDMDVQMKKQFKETFDLINSSLNETFSALFGGGKAKLVLEDENDLLNTGIDIDVQPPGKQVKSIRLFSGGEKALIAMSVLFTILKVKPSPLIVFDEVESALDQANVERFARYIHNYSQQSQFIVITHRPGTMAQCETLFGVTMQNRGISELLKVKLLDAIELAEKESVGE